MICDCEAGIARIERTMGRLEDRIRRMELAIVAVIVANVGTSPLLSSILGF